MCGDLSTGVHHSTNQAAPASSVVTMHCSPLGTLTLTPLPPAGRVQQINIKLSLLSNVRPLPSANFRFIAFQHSIEIENPFELM